MRKALASAVIALAVAVPMAPSAFAAPSPNSTCVTAHDISAKAYKKAAKKVKKAKKIKSTFVNAGWVKSVNGNTLTFTVKGGPDKCLRNKDLTVTVTDTTKITRDDVAVPLSAVLAGDHVNVKGNKSTLVDVGTMYTATRVSAGAPEAPAAP